MHVEIVKSPTVWLHLFSNWIVIIQHEVVRIRKSAHTENINAWCEAYFEQVCFLNITFIFILLFLRTIKANKRICLIQPLFFLLMRLTIFPVCSDNKFIFNNTRNYLISAFIVNFLSYIVFLSLCLVTVLRAVVFE